MADRLLAKVDTTGPVARPGLSACWIWKGSVRKDGYGQFWYNNTNGTAHRASYIVHFGPIPDGMSVLHRCDVPLCIRPDHLFVGTQAQNMADMAAKARGKEQKKTHCVRGHAYSPDNTLLTTKRARVCRTCRELRDRGRRRG